MSVNNIIDDIYFEESIEGISESLRDREPIDSMKNVTTLSNDDTGDVSVQDDEGSTIDTSWVHDFSRLQHIYNNQQRELMDTVTASFIYINKNNYIDRIVSEIINLDIDPEQKFSFISKENLLKIIQERKVLTQFSKYKLSDILSFVVDLEPEFIQDFFRDESFFDEKAKTFLKVLPVFNDIRINKTIFIFRNVNHLYFIFNESEINHQNRSTLKSILKPSDRLPSDKNSNTKKVRIEIDIRKNRSTKKNRN
jgi:hypothetical protein